MEPLAHIGPHSHSRSHSQPQITCLNCGEEVLGHFCAQCGQAAETQRITMKHWLHEIPHSIWHVDKGLPYTLGQLLRHPGRTLRRYLAGQRAPFFRPLTMLLVITALLTFFYVVLDLRPYNAHDTSLPAEMNAIRERFVHFFARYMNWFSVAMLPISAMLLKWGMRRADLNYAECLTVATFVTAVSHFISLMAVPLLYLMNGTANGQRLMSVVVVLTIAYQVRAFSGLLAETGLGPAARLVRGFLTAAAISVVTMIAVMLLIAYVNRAQFAELGKGGLTRAQRPPAARPAPAIPVPRSAPALDRPASPGGSATK